MGFSILTLLLSMGVKSSMQNRRINAFLSGKKTRIWVDLIQIFFL
jgi:hypothetical protein